LDLELSRYIPGFRDEYFLVEVKDMWMKRFRASSVDFLDERFSRRIPMVEHEDGCQVEAIDVALIDSIVGEHRCELCVEVCVILRGSVRQYRREHNETWTFVCEPQKDAVMRVESIEQVTS